MPIPVELVGGPNDGFETEVNDDPTPLAIVFPRLLGIRKGIGETRYVRGETRKGKLIYNYEEAEPKLTELPTTFMGRLIVPNPNMPGPKSIKFGPPPIEG